MDYIAGERKQGKGWHKIKLLRYGSFKTLKIKKLSYAFAVVLRDPQKRYHKSRSLKQISIFD